MMSIKLIVISLTIFLLATQTSAVYVECCRRYMKTKIPFAVIRGYSVQLDRELCPINAIIFHTKRGKACTDPALNWVMEYVNRLRHKAQLVHKTSKVQKQASKRKIFFCSVKARKLSQVTTN